jgi:hypothetical protein
MSSTRKVLFAIGCLGPLPIATALLLAAAYSDFDGGAGGWLGPTLIAIYYVMVGSMVVTLIAVVVHIARRHDLQANSERAG